MKHFKGFIATGQEKKCENRSVCANVTSIFNHNDSSRANLCEAQSKMGTNVTIS